MATGRIKKFDDEKGYGFILPDQAGEDVFFHRTGVLQRPVDLQKGDEVQFDLTTMQDGRTRAINVMPT